MSAALVPLPAGSLLYRAGTSPVLDGPAFFGPPEVARHYKRVFPDRTIYTYQTVRPLRLRSLYSLSDVLRYGGNNSVMHSVRRVCRHYDGWYVEQMEHMLDPRSIDSEWFYTEEVMLCDPSAVLLVEG